MKNTKSNSDTIIVVNISINDDFDLEMFGYP